MAYKIHPVILCGGSGTRLWPLSTPERPKQFLALTSEKSMIEDTAFRLRNSLTDALEFSDLLVVGAKRHAALLETALPDAKKILEPFGRNSAPAVAAACLVNNPDDLVLILPADHDIRDMQAFHEAIEIASNAAMDGAIVTFGIEPTHPSTGYGYIRSKNGEPGTALQVETFVEKPDLDTAKRYLSDGTYYWNAGIFLFKASTMIDAFCELAPTILESVRAALGDVRSDLIHLDPIEFEATPSISVDYAILEKTSNVKTVPVSMGWSDVGGYRALQLLLTENDALNYTRGPVYVTDSEGLYVRSEGPTISVSGVSNLVIVATPDEVMIAPADNDDAVKHLGAASQNRRYAFGISPQLTQRATSWLWGAFETWSQRGWDEVNGGFFEQLRLDGTPDALAERRVRVQGRQIYSFSKAIEMGWTGSETARALVKNGIDYVDRNLRHADGGFVHRVTATGDVVDDRRDLYDHAFLITAGTAAYKVTGNELGLQIAEDAISYIDRSLRDHTFGGWLESSLLEKPRRANPHMHLLEAMLEHNRATGSTLALEHAAEIVRLFETRFFNPATDVMGEYFTHDWRLEIPEYKVFFEPGHHYEWASLLHQYERTTGHDTLSWRRRLIRRADQAGLNPKSGFAINALRADGETLNKNSRLWHQLEMLRAYLVHPDIATRPKCEAVLGAIFESFIEPAPAGCWVDEIDPSGRAISNAIPASMLYHLVTAFERLIDIVGLKSIT